MDVREQVAMQRAVAKLQALGSRLGFPHQSAIRGADNTVGLRELRPRAGRSRWRLLYSALRTDTFIVLAIAPEAHVSKRRFRTAVVKASARFAELGQ